MTEIRTTPDEQPVRRARGGTVLALAAGFTVLALGIGIRVADLRLAPVLSNSMQPTFSAGDLVITRAVRTSDIQVGDVVTIVPPSGSRPVIHRVTSISDGVITTKGDANGVEDPWQARLVGATSYRLFFVVPAIGWLTELQRPALLVAGVLLGLAVLLEFVKEVRRRPTGSRPLPRPLS